MRGVVVRLSPAIAGARWNQGPGGALVLEVPAGEELLRFRVTLATADSSSANAWSP